MVASMLLATLTSLIFAAAALAVQPPPLSGDANRAYSTSQLHIQSAYPEEPRPDPGFRVDYYSHLLAAHPTGERDAWTFAQQHDQGPIHVQYDPARKSAYVTTKIPRASTLGLRWGLNQPEISFSGHRRTKDLYAFWRVERGRATLLALDAWAEGAQAPQVMSWHDVYDGLRRPVAACASCIHL